jgi:glutamate-1-semialdehyde 2,1-aminomutase
LLERNATTLKKALADKAEDQRLPAQVHSIASMYQIFFTDTTVTDYACAKHSDTQMFSAYFHELLRQGVFIPPSQYETCFVSAAHTDEDIEFTIAAFDKALSAAAKARKTP